ncbi:TrmB family transcriptional regulator [bacterium]|nr:TrmB family transcriptional regulator [bacterium]
MDEIVSKLKEIGLNEYQSKVYIAMLKKYPATGYEISKLANIPQSRAYDTLKSLESLHIVTSTGTNPVTYVPVKPKELIKRYKRKIDSTLDFLNKKLPDVKEDDYTEPIMKITGKTKITDKAIELINGAKKSVCVTLFSSDFKHLEQHLLDAFHRGLEIKIVKLDNFVCNFGQTFEHFGISLLEHYRLSRFLFLSTDDNEGLFGVSENLKDGTSEAIWTQNPEIVFLIKAMSLYNMYFIDITENFPEQLKYFYGTGLKRLKDKILR